MCSRHSNFYQKYVMPYFVHGGCSMSAFSRMREKIVPRAEGVVAEIGFGSGLNLPYYDPGKVSRLIGIEPDPAMLRIARKQMGKYPIPLELLEARGEELHLPDASVDTVVVTYTLCTIPDPDAATYMLIIPLHPASDSKIPRAAAARALDPGRRFSAPGGEQTFLVTLPSQVSFRLTRDPPRSERSPQTNCAH